MAKLTVRLPPTSELPRLRRALFAWHRRHGLRAPWRSSGDPYQVLVAAVMAQQTQMSRVLPKFDEFMLAFPTVEALARARTANVLRVWGELGYNLRALRLQRAARRIVRDGFPRTAEELEQIEGVGPFTAAIVASFAFGEPAAAVDTNVRRVVGRLAAGDVDGAISDKLVQEASDALVSRRAGGRWNQAVMDLGARVCVPRTPRCDECPVARWCRARPLFAKTGGRRTAERRAGYRAEPPYAGSRRYYRGRIVAALRDLPAGESIDRAELRRRLPGDKLGAAALRDIVEALRRDGLLRIEAGGRLRLP